MNKKTNVKNYSTAAKVVAIILLVLTPISVMISVSEAVMINEVSEFDTYYSWEITGAEAEKQPDGKYPRRQRNVFSKLSERRFLRCSEISYNSRRTDGKVPNAGESARGYLDGTP